MSNNETMVEQARERIVSIWCEYANRLISPHGNDMQAISMRTDAMAATSRELNQAVTQAVREREREIAAELWKIILAPATGPGRQSLEAVGNVGRYIENLEKETQNVKN